MSSPPSCSGHDNAAARNIVDHDWKPQERGQQAICGCMLVLPDVFAGFGRDGAYHEGCHAELSWRAQPAIEAKYRSMILLLG